NATCTATENELKFLKSIRRPLFSSFGKSEDQRWILPLMGCQCLTFVNDTNVTMKTPSGSSTNFSIDPNLAALFPNPIYVYFGIMPDATAQANKGQAIILSRARVQGSIDTIDDDFLSDSNGLDTAHIWTI